MARKRSAEPTLQQLAARRVGRLKSYKVVAFLVCWAISEEALGHPPTLEEYADWWRESRSTVFREQALYRDAFPGELTPERLVEVLRQRDPAWYRMGVSGAAKLVVRVDELRRRDGQAREAE